ncbi:SDR family oxidoreductase [Sphingobacterium haloxyli]|uniref:Uncharacterized protein n=1 Tax=Sphingobacterium haloxyli TaxID=2100533 RepID=A0A2S9J6M7_9SPHI|nr:hypothetical protein [Sphingobacterium haloxyli]PRD48410.1 hypothetical protein C5745_04185 [Sphingobacterium haloxyli]
MNILISGLNNYVGRRCTNLMADENFHVFAITRNRALFEKRLSEPLHAEVFEYDLLKGETDGQINVPDLKASFYFTQVPTLDDIVNLRVELLCLRNFIHLVKRMGCNRIVYVARLMDKQALEPILNLLKEFALDYTVILKNIVLGKDCLLYNVYRSIAKKRFVFYSKRYGGNLLQPIGVNDFVRWLKAVLDVPAFHYTVLEVGGAETITAVDLYGVFRDLKLKLASQTVVYLPHWLLNLISKRSVASDTAMAEFLRGIQEESVVANTWKKHLSFTFSSIEQILLAE